MTKRGAQRARGRRKAERRANRWRRALSALNRTATRIFGPALLDAIPRFPSFVVVVDPSNGPDHTAHITLRRPA